MYFPRIAPSDVSGFFGNDCASSLLCQKSTFVFGQMIKPLKWQNFINRFLKTLRSEHRLTGVVTPWESARAGFQRALDKIMKTIEPSPSEIACGLNVDFFSTSIRFKSDVRSGIIPLFKTPFHSEARET